MKNNCTDYDGMGNQGRFPTVKKSKKEIEVDSIKTFLIVAIAFFSLIFLGITLNY
tara:strand:- start:136 stop:300 length:165 start_codon:yes stop_codon:yes gene_type:complete